MAIDLDESLDRRSPEADGFLKGLQGNILKAHGRHHAWHLIIDFGEPSDEKDWKERRGRVRSWIGGMAETRVTDALTQSKQEKADDCHTLLLSSAGYQFLDEKRPKEGGGAFRKGMQNSISDLHDPAFEEWEPVYQHRTDEIHALVIIANDDTTKLAAAKAKLEADVVGFGGRILVSEAGDQQTDVFNGKEREIEHFGYADGVSQPQFIYNGQAEKEAEKEKAFSQLTPLKRVLDEDRHARGTFGSFVVYRKLEQNVKSFNEAVQRVSDDLGLDIDLAGAMTVGRFKNGTPVTSYETRQSGYDPHNDEDFDFDNDEDKDGGRCPFHAHIRKVNPRGSVGGGLFGFIVRFLAKERKRRIVRRGITYGARPDRENGGEPPLAGVGLIFICYQNDISDQFEFIQKQWANDRKFPIRGKAGIDPVIGRAGGEEEDKDDPHYPTKWDAPKDDRQRVKFGEHVRLRGGEYFYAPSMQALKNLSAAE